MDHRIRKRDCKHIRLVLQSLNVQNEPDNWKPATVALVDRQAGKDDKKEGMSDLVAAECLVRDSKASTSRELHVKDEPIAQA